MKIKQLSNFKKTLIAHRRDEIVYLDKLDSILKEIEKIQLSSETRCPKCYGRDLRMMKYKRLFCRACGYESPK